MCPAHAYYPMESNTQPASSPGAPGTTSRQLSRVYATPPAAPGFIGAGHTAVEVLAPHDLAASDPFVLLMDDRLDIPTRRQIGGAHPHAGIETVTLVLEGTVHDRDEGPLSAGDLIWMTAGRGIIHNEAVEAAGRSRILQLWVALPAGDRELAPGFQVMRREMVPVVRGPGVEGRLYSGVTGSTRSATRNRVPVTLLDLELAPGARFQQDLPASYNGFVYLVDGAVSIGGQAVEAGEVGWLAPAPAPAPHLLISAGARSARLVLYAGQPLSQPLIQHGPFVAGSRAEIATLYQRFRAGQFTSMSQLARDQRHHDREERTSA